MKLSTHRKDTLRTLNAHMVTALLSIFIGGLALICIGFLFGFKTFELSSNGIIIIDLYQWLSIIIIMLGLILILLGALQSLRLIKRIKSIFDAILSGRNMSQIGDGDRMTTGIRGGLEIIRPELRETQPEDISTRKETEKKPEPQKKKTAGVQKHISPSPKAKNEKSGETKEGTVDISLEEALQKIVDRYNDPKVAKAFSSWDETLMMTFPDIDKSYCYKINNDEGIELAEGHDEEAAVQVNLSSDIFIKMMTKQINPIKAYSSGELEVSGKMRNLLKLRKLMF